MKSRKFPEQPYLVAVQESGERWVNDIEYVYEIINDGVQIYLIVPKGFRTDGASVPRWAWTLIGFLPRGIHDPAALIHDWLYENKGTVRTQNWQKKGWQTGYFKYSRKDADRLFLKILEQVGVKSWHARLAYLAVRGFGAWQWRD